MVDSRIDDRLPREKVVMDSIMRKERQRKRTNSNFDPTPSTEQKAEQFLISALVLGQLNIDFPF